MSNINSNDRFIRWQTNLRNQVSFTNNLLLTISFGVCGFFFNLLTTDEFQPYCCNKMMFNFGLKLLIFSIILGILTNISRIVDFRVTLKKIKGELQADKELDILKYWKDVFGKITWILFYLQIIVLLISLIFLIFGFTNYYSAKLN